MLRSFGAQGLAVALLLTAVAAADDTPAAKPGQATAKVEKGPFTVSVTAKGVFEADTTHEVALRPEAWTALSVMQAVEQGAGVKKGDVLVTFDTDKIDRAIRDLEADRYLADLGLKQAAEDLALLEKSTPLELAATERAKKQAEEDKKKFTEHDRAFAERSAQQLVKNASNYLDYAKEELKQLEKMYKAKDLTEETEEIILRRQRNQVEAAAFQLKTMENQRDQALKIDLPRKAETLEEATAKATLALEKARTTLPSALQQKRLSLEKARYEREKAAEKLRQLQKDRELLTVKAPADGVVYYGRCVRGQWPNAASVAEKLRRGGAVLPDEVFLTIVPPKALTVRAVVEEKDLQYLKTGARAVVTPVAFPDQKLPAVLRGLSAVPVSAGSFDARLALEGDKAQDGLTAGLACGVKLIVYKKDDALTVPAAAVFGDDDEDQHFVYLANGKEPPVKTAVKVGKRSGARVEILEGLKEGDTVQLEKPDAKKGA